MVLRRVVVEVVVECCGWGGGIPCCGVGVLWSGAVVICSDSEELCHVVLLW